MNPYTNKPGVQFLGCTPQAQHYNFLHEVLNLRFIQGCKVDNLKPDGEVIPSGLSCDFTQAWHHQGAGKSNKGGGKSRSKYASFAFLSHDGAFVVACPGCRDRGFKAKRDPYGEAEGRTQY